MKLMIRFYIALYISKIVQTFLRVASLSAGGTWPGEIALRIDPAILRFFTHQPHKVVVVAGTNGKTTTAKMVTTILRDTKLKAAHNDSGANLDNGIVSTYIANSTLTGKLKADYFIFEVDEASLPKILQHITPATVVLLNLFRDQLDRYGEVDTIAEKWQEALDKFGSESVIIANADDPHLAYIGAQLKSPMVYFGIGDPKYYLPKMEHATDTIYCPRCSARLLFSGIYFSHLGDWKCDFCKLVQPKVSVKAKDFNTPLAGTYNIYNSLAAASTAINLDLPKKEIQKSLNNFSPAFGRLEEFETAGKKVKILLSKNPTGFNESLRTSLELGARYILLALNDRIPDGRDVSWIWDVDFEMLPAWITPVVSGDRALDLALRLKYARPVNKLPKGAVSEPETPILIYEKLSSALEFCLRSLPKDEMLYILPTYSAMLEIRKTLLGKKIL